jgi:putative ABC transport system permease protein
MLLLAMAIGVVAVNLLTGLAEGARQFVIGEFAMLGRNTLIVLPGRKETTGGMPPITGLATRDLTLGDAEAIGRLPSVRRIAPLQAGQLEVNVGNRVREAFTLGTSHEFFVIRQLSVGQGQVLPPLPLDQAEAVCVIGATLRRELFGTGPALGQWLRAGDRRFRVVGILSERGESLGMDFGEMLIIPVASAQVLFNREGLFRVFAEVRGPQFLESGKRQILATIAARHEGKEDVTLISQDSMLAAFDGILGALGLALAGIAAISLLVAGILIMNVTWIAVNQRTAEIGLLKALGAGPAQVRLLFVGEAALLALAGGLIGLGLSELLLWLGRQLWDIPLQTPLWARLGSLLLAMLAALLFAWLPANQAARMEPLAALRPPGARA